MASYGIPSSNLEIISSLSNSPFLRIGNSAGGGGQTVGINLTPWTGRTGGPSTQIIAIDNGYSADLTMWTAPVGAAGANIAVERMRIKTDGSVGIGTANPGAALQIGDATSVYQTPGSYITKLSVTDSGYAANGNKVSIFLGTQGSANNGFFMEYCPTSSASTNYFRFIGYGGGQGFNQQLVSGSVGIGTTNPVSPLQIQCIDYYQGGITLSSAATNATGPLEYMIQRGPSGGNILGAGTNSSNIMIFHTTNDTTSPGGGKTGFVWMSSGTRLGMYFDTTNSRLGIGTTNPIFPLHVSNATVISNTNSQVFLSNSATSSVNYTQVGSIGFSWGGDMPSFAIQSQTVNRDGGAGPYYDYGAQSDLRFIYKAYSVWPFGTSANATKEAMRISGTSGNVGIGTNNNQHTIYPAAKLVVAKDVTLTTGHFAGDVGCQIQCTGATNIAQRLSLMYDTTLDIGLIQAQVAGTGTSSLCLNAAGGNVGIGDNLSPSYALDVTGAIRATQDITAFSDRRVKSNLEKITGALDKVAAINGYTFTRTDSDSNERHAGVVAQEVQEVLPEVVSTDGTGHLSVAYGNITALLIEALKEEKNKREALEARIAALELRPIV